MLVIYSFVLLVVREMYSNQRGKRPIKAKNTSQTALLLFRYSASSRHHTRCTSSCQCLLLPRINRLYKGHALLNLCNGQRWVQALGASPRAVENGVASVQGHGVVKGVLSLGGLFVSRIGDPSVRLKEDGWAEIFFAIPPVRGTRCATAGTQNTFV